MSEVTKIENDYYRISVDKVGRCGRRLWSVMICYNPKCSTWLRTI
jgi:hypothetical protein